MRISTIAYILKQGFKNIWRNLRFSLASVATMAACIFLFGLFLSIVMNFNYIVDSAEKALPFWFILKRVQSRNRLTRLEKKLRVVRRFPR